MRVRYQIIVEAEADGLAGPLYVLTQIDSALRGKTLAGSGVNIGKLRLAAVYPVAPAEQAAVVERVPGSDQSRPVEEVRDRRIT